MSNEVSSAQIEYISVLAKQAGYSDIRSAAEALIDGSIADRRTASELIYRLKIKLGKITEPKSELFAVGRLTTLSKTKNPFCLTDDDYEWWDGEQFRSDLTKHTAKQFNSSADTAEVLNDHKDAFRIISQHFDPGE